MRGQEDRAALARQAPQGSPHAAARERVHSDCRLIEEQERGLRGDDRGDHSPLLLAPGEGDRQPVCDLLDAHLGERLVHARPGGLPVEATGAEVRIDLLAGGEVEEWLAFLRDHRDEGADLLWVRHDVVAEDFDAPGTGDEQGRRDPQERGLPGPVAAQEGDPLALLQAEGDPAQSLHRGRAAGVVGLPHVDCAEGFLGHGGAGCRASV